MQYGPIITLLGVSAHLLYTNLPTGSTDTPGTILTRPQLVPWRFLVVVCAHSGSIEYLCVIFNAHNGWDGAGDHDAVIVTCCSLCKNVQCQFECTQNRLPPPHARQRLGFGLSQIPVLMLDDWTSIAPSGCRTLAPQTQVFTPLFTINNSLGYDFIN